MSFPCPLCWVYPIGRFSLSWRRALAVHTYATQILGRRLVRGHGRTTSDRNKLQMRERCNSTWYNAARGMLMQDAGISRVWADKVG